MRARRPVAILLTAMLIVAAAGAVRAEAPEAGGRERQWYLVRATREFDAGRFEQAALAGGVALMNRVLGRRAVEPLRELAKLPFGFCEIAGRQGRAVRFG